MLPEEGISGDVVCSKTRIQIQTQNMSLLGLYFHTGSRDIQ